ncbi:MAG: phosphotransferase [Cyclonatronaceae bacterium]
MLPTGLIAYRKELKQNSGDISPGWYFIRYPYAIRIGSEVPLSVKEDFSERLFGVGSIKGIISRLYTMLFSLVRIRHTAGHNGPADRTLIKRSMHGHLMMFDFEHGKVIIKYRDAGLAARIAGYASMEPGYLPTLDVEYDGKSTVQSPMVKGINLYSTGPDVRHEHFRNLLGYFLERIEATRIHGTCMSDDEANAFIARNSSGYFTDDLMLQLSERRHQILRILTSVPVIFSHGDLHSENILVCDDRIVVIDFEHCCQMHAFYDVVYNPFDGFIAGYDHTFFDEMCRGVYDREYRGIFRTYMPVGSIDFMDVILAFIICRADRGRLYPVDKLQNISALAASGRKLPVL